ncbi:MAG: glycosyltransferase [Chitinophagaceae bacterium]|nr:glycosyltransferase [Chitinophagaceae bacterium]
MPRIPYPLRDGGSIAMNQTLEAYLEQGCEVSLLAMNTSRHWVEESSLPPIYQQLTNFRTVYVKTNINPLSAFFNLFTDKSYNVERFVNKEFEKELIVMLGEESYDFIQFESIYTAPYLKIVRKQTDVACFCRVHNIEFLIWQRLSEHETSFLKRKYLELLTNRLKSFEEDILKQFNLLLPISQKEEAYLTQTKSNSCYYLPFGVEENNDQINPNIDKQSIYHIGSMDWAPNVEGIHWFLDKVWPLVHEKLPHIHVYLAGKNMPASIHTIENLHINVVGEIDDVMKFSLEKNIMIVPLLSGAGIRIKILEAMALGKTIVTTQIGAEGIGATHHENILIADTPEEFVACLHDCFTHPEKSAQLGKKAQEFVYARFGKSTIYAQWIDHLKSIL